MTSYSITEQVIVLLFFIRLYQYSWMFLCGNEDEMVSSYLIFHVTISWESDTVNQLMNQLNLNLTITFIQI